MRGVIPILSELMRRSQEKRQRRREVSGKKSGGQDPGSHREWQRRRRWDE